MILEEIKTGFREISSCVTLSGISKITDPGSIFLSGASGVKIYALLSAQRDIKIIFINMQQHWVRMHRIY